jgi:peptidoglycan/LPS O-acetylase OafA/YrhL
MSSSPTQPRENLGALPFVDGLRGIAILGVMADHLFITGLGAQNAAFSASFSLFMAMGQRGVQLFFLVSAFTLYSSYSRRAGREHSPRRNFYLRRAFRILPLWWAATLLFAWMRNRFTAADLLPNLFMYFGFYRFSGVEMVGWGWSIFVEETFYLIFPLVVIHLTNMRRAAAFFVATYAISYAWLRGAAFLRIPDDFLFINWFPLNHWYSFAMGIILFLLWRRPEVKRALFDDKTARRWLTLGCAVLLLEGFNQPTNRGMLAMAAFFLMSLHEGGPVAWICRNRLVQQFGKCCYSLYLFHMISIEWLASLNVSQRMAPWGLPGEVNFLILFPAVALLNLAAGKLLWRFAEKPTIEWGKRVIRRLEAEDQKKIGVPQIKAA